MDEELEKSLADLKPREPSLDLEASIAAELRSVEEGGTRSRIGKIVTFIALAAAACIALVVMLDGGKAEDSAEEFIAVKEAVESEFAGPRLLTDEIVSGFEPIERITEVLAAERSPVFYLENGEPAQSVYVKYLDTIVMGNEKLDASFIIAQPREEYRVVPVASY
ncbi:MAG: hypothetical protein AAGB46_00650 [Verrucomicrobiota bacterium]